MRGWLDTHLYPDYMRNWDNILFRERILKHLSPQSVVLDVGAGSGRVAEMDFRHNVARICGIDLDPRVSGNPLLDEARVGDAASIPYDGETFDLVFSDNVMEHLPQPESVFSEVYRVLKPGGLFLFKTPNRTHYVPLIARITPHGFHKFVNRVRGRAEEDTFPTLYRANSLRQVSRLASDTGFDVVRIDRIEGRPEYLRVNAVLYLLGAVYERIVNATGILAAFRVLLVAELRKPKAAAE